MKLSIDLCDNEGRLVPEEQLIEVTGGCRRVLDSLGSRRVAVKLFKVTFEKLPLTQAPGTCFIVHTKDPDDHENSYKFDFQLFEKVNPSADDIVKKLSPSLTELIRCDLVACRNKASRLSDIASQWIGPRQPLDSSI